MVLIWGLTGGGGWLVRVVFGVNFRHESLFSTFDTWNNRMVLWGDLGESSFILVSLVQD